MRILGLGYLGAGLAFFFFPSEVFYLINVGPKVFKMFQDIPEPSEHFWLSLTFSMMMMLTLIAVYSSFQPKNRALILVHLLSKLTSTAAFIYCFFKNAKLFAYIAGAVLDGGIFLLVLVFFIRMLAASENPAKPTTASEPQTEPYA